MTNRSFRRVSLYSVSFRQPTSVHPLNPAPTITLQTLNLSCKTYLLIVPQNFSTTGCWFPRDYIHGLALGLNFLLIFDRPTTIILDFLYET